MKNVQKASHKFIR